MLLVARLPSVAMPGRDACRAVKVLAAQPEKAQGLLENDLTIQTLLHTLQLARWVEEAQV